MKIIVSTLAGTLGPFVTVTEHENHIEADGAIYPRTVIGEATVEDQGDWQPPPAPPVVPAVVSPRQIRQALTALGLRSAVEAAVAAGDQNLKDWWEFATAFERAHPRVIAMAQALDVSTEELDQLFIVAAGL